MSSRSQIGESAEDLAEFLRQETTGGRLLLLATAFALIWANVAGIATPPKALTICK